MEIGLAIIGDLEQSKSDLIVGLSDELNVAFKDKSYGISVKSFIIGIVCVAPQFEQFFKVRKPKFTKGKKIINPDGIPFTLEDSFEYNIKIDYKSLNIATDAETTKIITSEIVNSLIILDDMKIKNFNIKKFREDIECYFKEKK